MVTAVIKNPGVTVDPYSNEEVESWDTPTIETYENCVLAPRESTEPLRPGRTPVYAGYVLYAPYGIDVTARSRVEINDKEYEVEGEPFAWASPHTGTKAGTEIPLKRTEG